MTESPQLMRESAAANQDSSFEPSGKKLITLKSKLQMKKKSKRDLLVGNSRFNLRKLNKETKVAQTCNENDNK